MSAIDGRPWRLLGAIRPEEIPSGPGIFELATLVRSVLLISDDGGQGLRSAIALALRAPGLGPRAHCVRFASLPDPRAALEQRIAAYRESHAGRLPPAQAAAPAPAREASRRPAHSPALPARPRREPRVA